MTIQVNGLCKMGPVWCASSFQGGKKDLFLSTILWDSKQARSFSNIVECWFLYHTGLLQDFLYVQPRNRK